MPASPSARLTFYECPDCGIVAPAWGKVTPRAECVCGCVMAEITDRTLEEFIRPTWRMRP